MALLSKNNREQNLEKLQAYLKTDRAKLIICISIAFVFWFFTKMSKTYTSQLTLGMDYQPDRAWTFLKKPQPDEVFFELEGTGWALLQGHLFGFPETLPVPLDDRVNSTVSGANLRAKLQLKLDDDIRVTASSEEAILIELDSAERKKVPVVLEQDIDFSDGYQLKNPIQFSPDSITLFGPKQLISTYTAYPIQKISKQKINKDLQFNIALQKPPKKEIRLSEDEVNISIETELYEQKAIEIPITVLNGQDSIYLDQSTVTIYGNIGSSQNDRSDIENIKAFVDFKAAKEQQHLIVTVEDIPSYMNNIRYYPLAVGFYVVK